MEAVAFSCGMVAIATVTEMFRPGISSQIMICIGKCKTVSEHQQ